MHIYDHNSPTNLLVQVYISQLSVYRTIGPLVFNMMWHLIYVPSGHSSLFARKVLCHGIMVMYFSVYEMIVMKPTLKADKRRRSITCQVIPH